MIAICMYKKKENNILICLKFSWQYWLWKIESENTKLDRFFAISKFIEIQCLHQGTVGL